LYFLKSGFNASTQSGSLEVDPFAIRRFSYREMISE
jgi:hypothetical protein